jgi:hypothetical protein
MTPISNNSPDRPRPPPPDLLMRPLARLLRPLVRLLIQSGITFPVFADMVRGLFIEVALRDMLTDPKARTDSRVSLLTGIHRKEIRRQRSPDAGGDEPDIVTRTSAIVGRWLGSPLYTDHLNKPLTVPRSGPAPSFEALVASVTRDVRARAVLDEWLSQGIAALEADDMVRLNVEAFLPHQGAEAQVFYFSRNLHDHVAAASANVAASGPPPFLDRSVHYDRLSPEAAARLEAAGREAAQAMLLDINRTATTIADADDAERASLPPEALVATRRVNIGVYVYSADDDEAPANPRDA